MPHEESKELGALLMSYAGAEPSRVRTAIAALAKDDAREMKRLVQMAQDDYLNVLKLADVQNGEEQRAAELRGMTVNERLVACGVIDKWDAAAVRRSRADMIAVLRSVEMTEEQAAWTTDAVLKAPSKYGF
jgi:hypothetical protein